jgi:hypothetical protein
MYLLSRAQHHMFPFFFVSDFGVSLIGFRSRLLVTVPAILAE